MQSVARLIKAKISAFYNVVDHINYVVDHIIKWSFRVDHINYVVDHITFSRYLLAESLGTS